jgi:hypothetical protein
VALEVEKISIKPVYRLFRDFEVTQSIAYRSKVSP